MKHRAKNQAWERTIDKLLGDKNPCKVCLVKSTCPRSFSDKSACEKLEDEMIIAMQRLKDEKYENKN